MRKDDIYIPDAYLQNRMRVRGIGTNLLDANILSSYLKDKKEARDEYPGFLGSLLSYVKDLTVKADKIRLFKGFYNSLSELPLSDLRYIRRRLEARQSDPDTKLNLLKSLI